VLAAGISIFELARVMGASVKTTDKHYGHLARDSEQAIRALASTPEPRVVATWWRQTATDAKHRPRRKLALCKANVERERRDSNPRPPA
jgi:predicted deacetylase